jgi:hypothetical protein
MSIEKVAIPGMKNAPADDLTGTGVEFQSGGGGRVAVTCSGGVGAALLDSRPVSEEGSCMDPARLPHAPHPLAPDSQNTCARTQ